MVSFVVPDKDAKARLHRLLLSDSRKLRYLQNADPAKQWWSINETRFCRLCEHLFIGRDIRFWGEDDFPSLFTCPTHDCPGSFEDWEYPQLHL